MGAGSIPWAGQRIDDTVGEDEEQKSVVATRPPPFGTAEQLSLTPHSNTICLERRPVENRWAPGWIHPGHLEHDLMRLSLPDLSRQLLGSDTRCLTPNDR